MSSRTYAGASSKSKSSRNQDSSPPRRAKPSQSASQARGGRKSRRHSDDEDDDERDNAMDEYGDEEHREATIRDRAHALVRLAIFAEANRGSLKRDDMNKKVFGNDTRSFKIVFAAAQKILQKTFGMEMVELMSRNERDIAFNPDQKKSGVNATSGAKQKVSTSTSKTYIVRSTLPSALIELLAAPDPEIRAAARGVVPDDDIEDDSIDTPDDTLVAWRPTDNPVVVGILHVILALILANGRTIPDPQLRAQLKKLRLRPNVIIPNSSRSTQAKPFTIDTLLLAFVRSNYLDRQRTATAGGDTGRGRKRAAGDADGEGSTNDDFEWKWGTRSLAEINEVGVALMVQDFMGEQFRAREQLEEGAADDENGKSEAQLKHEKAVMNDLVRGTGGGALLENRDRRRRDDDDGDDN